MMIEWVYFGLLIAAICVAACAVLLAVDHVMGNKTNGRRKK
jgi:hypothetical protein